MINISVIVPVYNASRYLHESIESILGQTYSDFELLLIDDGSKDDSGRICDYYAQKDTRIQVYHQDNRGVSVARNVGLDNAKGNWIAFADADDIMLPNALEKLYEAATNYHSDIIMGSTKVMVNGDIYPYKEYICESKNSPLLSIGHSALWGYLFRRDVIVDNNIRFVEGLAYSEDRVFITELALNCKCIVSLSSYVYVYRRNEQSACFNKDGIMKSYHDFWAAAIIKKLSEKVTNQSYVKALVKVQKSLMNAGYVDFVENSFSLSNYRRYKKHYLLFFGNKRSLLWNTIWAWITIRRRRFFTLKDNPLKTNNSVISKIIH